MHLLVIICLFANILYAYPMHTKDCAHGIDTITGLIKTSPLQKPVCKTIAIDIPKQRTIQYIRNYHDLFQMLPVEYNQQFLDHYLVKRLLENPHINVYTLTIAYLETKDIFDTYTDIKPNINEYNLTKFYKQHGDAMISHVISGGLHLRLYHIIANSQKHYQLLKKKLLYIKSPDKLKQMLIAIQSSSPVIVKEYFTKELNAITTSDLTDSFLQSNYFDSLISTQNTAYKYHLRPYTTASDHNRSIQKAKVKNRISEILRLYFALHNYQYYRQHHEDFYPLSKQAKHTLINVTQNCLKQLKYKTDWKTDINISIANIIMQTIPKQYRSSIPTQKKLFPAEESIKLDIPNFSSKIMPYCKLLIKLEANLDIQNRGQIIRLHNHLQLKREQKIAETDTKKILYDTYVDFPGLRFHSLTQQYGSLQLELNMTTYQQYQIVQGSGILQSAACGYVLDTNKTLHIHCKQIKYTPIKPKFIHEEDVIKSNSEFGQQLITQP